MRAPHLFCELFFTSLFHPCPSSPAPPHAARKRAHCYSLPMHFRAAASTLARDKQHVSGQGRAFTPQGLARPSVAPFERLSRGRSDRRATCASSASAMVASRRRASSLGAASVASASRMPPPSRRRGWPRTRRALVAQVTASGAMPPPLPSFARAAAAAALCEIVVVWTMERAGSFGVAAGSGEGEPRSDGVVRR